MVETKNASGLNSSQLESLLIKQFKPPEYEKSELTEEELKELEEDNYPGAIYEQKWEDDRYNAKHVLPLFAAYQSSKNLDMLRESLTAMSVFYPEAMKFLREHPEISDGFLPFLANYIENIWNTPDKTFIEVLNSSEKLKTFSQSRPTHMEVPNERPSYFVRNNFSLTFEEQETGYAKEIFTYLMEEAFPNGNFEGIKSAIKSTLSGNKNKSHEEKLWMLNSHVFPLGFYIESIGHLLEKTEQIKNKGLNKLFFREDFGFAYLEEKNESYILRFYKEVPEPYSDFRRDAIGGSVAALRDYLFETGLSVRKTQNLDGHIRLDYNLKQQEEKMLMAMTKEGKKLLN